MRRESLYQLFMDFAAHVQRHRAFFQTGATRRVEFRRVQLQRLSAALERDESTLLAALKADLGKSPFQGYSSELGLVRSEIRHAQGKLTVVNVVNLFDTAD